MQNDLTISNVTFHAASAADIEAGLIGFIEFVVNGAVRVTGITLRRTRAGRYALSFPAPRKVPIFAPVDDESREAIEKQIFQAIGLDRNAAR